jgi:hypothetical protein
MRVVLRAVLAIVVSSGGLSAQELIQAQLPGITVVVNPKADRLREAAEALYEKPNAYRRAAVLHEKEAAARTAVDPKLPEALMQSARLYSYVGEAAKGRELFERSAYSSLQRGDVLRAAHAFVDAAFLSLRERNVEHSRELSRQAELLAASPLLTASQRAGILRRIDPARVEQAYAK